MLSEHDMVSDFVGDEGMLRISKQPGQPGHISLRLAGEADLRAAPRLRVLLASLTARSALTDIDLDLTRLEFIDVAATRSLVQAAAALGPGRRMVVRGAPAVLRRTIEFCWADHGALEVSSG